MHYSDAPHRRRVVAFVYQGPDAVQKVRDIAGPTNPHVARDTKPGCVRALGTVVPVKDADGNVIGDRMDNLIHASATPPEAEREIKLWFKPTDIPPLMRLFPTEVCGEHYYYKEGRLQTTYEVGSTLLMAPGEIVWKTDLDVVCAVQRGEEGEYSLNAVAAKYMINAFPDES